MAVYSEIKQIIPSPGWKAVWSDEKEGVIVGEVVCFALVRTIECSGKHEYQSWVPMEEQPIESIYEEIVPCNCDYDGYIEKIDRDHSDYMCLLAPGEEVTEALRQRGREHKKKREAER